MVGIHNELNVAVHLQNQLPKGLRLMEDLIRGSFIATLPENERLSSFALFTSGITSCEKPGCMQPG